ncbi:MAG: FtsW/RodA/SpoVE family cell cycle protein [Herbinix sp.]|nr:FtsW/RodA/SpoVE family cell cycle protein [Herbinix sp.]
MFNLKQYDFKRYNITLIIIVIILGVIGGYLIRLAKPGESLYIKQLAGLGGGILLAIFVSMFDYHFICGFYIVLYVFNLVLLVLVRVAGTSINHAKRWLDLGFTMFQPSELSKIILILFAAKLFTMFRQKINNAWVLILTTVSVALPTCLILIQTNLSTSLVIMFIFVIMIFAAGLSWKIILPIIVIGVPCVIGLFWYIQQDYQVLLQPYQQERVLSYLNPEQFQDTMYQQDNSVLAIGSGQLLGKILSEDAADSRNYGTIPIRESDFIFSVAGEEFGFIGSCLIICLYAVIVYICITTARKASDYMGMLIAIGIASMFTFQLFVNIGVATKLLPNTGIPLPFLSYGLSSLTSGMIAIGIILNIRLQPKRIRGRV